MALDATSILFPLREAGDRGLQSGIVTQSGERTTFAKFSSRKLKDIQLVKTNGPVFFRALGAQALGVMIDELSMWRVT